MTDPDPPHNLRQGLLDLGEVLGSGFGGSLRRETCDRLRRDKDALAHLATAALQHQCRGAAWLALCAAGLCAPLPPPLRDRLPAGHPARVLEDGWTHEHRHAETLSTQACEIITALNRVGLEPMLLKGMALMYSGILPEPGRRWMVDIDLMVRPQDIPAAVAVLDGLGYIRKAATGAPHHVPAAARPDGGAEVELHFSMVIPALQPALPTAAVWQAAVRHDRDGLRFFVPSRPDMLLHSALHGQETGHVRTLARVPVRALMDFAAIWQTSAEPPDWVALRHRAGLAGARPAFDSHLLQTCALLHRPWPLPGRPGLRSRLHWHLCLAVMARPRSVGQAVYTRYEMWQLLASIAPGRALPVRVAAGLTLTARLIAKYRWRLWARLLGKRP